MFVFGFFNPQDGEGHGAPFLLCSVRGESCGESDRKSVTDEEKEKFMMETDACSLNIFKMGNHVRLIYFYHQFILFTQ